MSDETPHDPPGSPLRLPESSMRALNTPATADDFSPLEPGGGWSAILKALLQTPGRIVSQLHDPRGGRRLAIALSVLAVVCLGLYGLLVGSFSRGEQLWAAPLKIAIGAVVSVLICLPSLYVLSCLSGASDRLRLGGLCGILLAVLALNGLLLVSFAPVAWVFSESTDSIAFISFLHLAFWAVGLYFGLRLLRVAMTFLGSIDRGYILLWTVIFVLVNLQMMTALRPLVGRAPQLLPTEKQFFVSHWVEVLQDDASGALDQHRRASDARD